MTAAYHYDRRLWCTLDRSTEHRMASVFSAPADIRYFEYKLSSRQRSGPSNRRNHQDVVRAVQFRRFGGLRIPQPHSVNICRHCFISDRMSQFCAALLHAAVQNHLLLGNRSSGRPRLHYVYSDLCLQDCSFVDYVDI